MYLLRIESTVTFCEHSCISSTSSAKTRNYLASQVNINFSRKTLDYGVSKVHLNIF